MSSVEQQALAAAFRTKQKGYLAEIDSSLDHLRVLADKCQAALASLIPELSNAVAEWQQAKADLKVLKERH